MSIKAYWFDFKIRKHVLKMRVVFCRLRNGTGSRKHSIILSLAVSFSFFFFPLKKKKEIRLGHPFGTPDYLF